MTAMRRPKDQQMKSYRFRAVADPDYANWIHRRARDPERLLSIFDGLQVMDGPLAGTAVSDPSLWEVQQLHPDTCAYCGQEYHPMPCYVNKNGDLLRVCNGVDISTMFDGDPDTIETTNCPARAQIDGYRFRKDLTPRR